MAKDKAPIPGLQLSYEMLRLTAENMDHFLFALPEKRKDNLAHKLQRERILAQALPPLSLTILKLLRKHERLTIAKLERLTEANQDTLKVRLRELTQTGQITKQGQARATWYSHS